MSYVNPFLQPGETDRPCSGRLHWIVYWPAILFLVLGIGAAWSWELRRRAWRRA